MSLIILFAFGWIFSSCLRVDSSAHHRLLSVDDDDIHEDPLFSGVKYIEANSSILFSRAYGYSSLEHEIHMKRNAQFSIGSNTKLFTAVALYQLQERGLVNISDNVAEYLDASDFKAFGFPNVTRWCPQLITGGPCLTLTFENLLSMSSGVIDFLNCDYPANSPYREYCQPSTGFLYPGSIAAVIRVFILSPLVFTPGTEYAYSNPNFILAAYLIEKLSGLSYSKYITQHILQPLGMRYTYMDVFNRQFYVSNDTDKPILAGEYYYYRDPDEIHDVYAYGVCSVELDPGSTQGTAGIVSNVHDMALWYRTLFGNQGESAHVILSPSSVASIVRPITSVGGGVYFAQGTIVAYKDAQAQQWPDWIMYQGGTICAHTAIIISFNQTNGPLPLSSPVIVAAFRNTVNYLVNESTWASAQQSNNRSFFELVEDWQKESDALKIVLDMLKNVTSLSTGGTD